MNSSTTYTRSTSAPRVRDHASAPAGGSRLADYVIDVFFIALLAAPFLIFEAPASVQEAVVAAHATDASVLGAVAAPAATPRAGDPAYGPE